MLRKLLGLAIVSISVSVFIGGSAHANEGPSVWMPDPNDTLNRQIYPSAGGSFGNRLYLAVGAGEHISNNTTFEIYSNGGGYTRIRLHEAQHCPTYTAPYHTTQSLDFGSGFNTQFRLYSQAGGLIWSGIVPACSYSTTDWQNRDAVFAWNLVANRRYKLVATAIAPGSAENLYRAQVEAGTARLGFGVGGWGGVSLSNRDLPGPSGGRSYGFTHGIHFGVDCNVTGGESRIRLYDDDWGRYQGVFPYPELGWRVMRKPRGPGAYSPWLSGTARGGQGAGSTITIANTSPGWSYRVALFDISRPNAIEILLPNTASQSTVAQSCGNYDYVPATPTMPATAGSGRAFTVSTRVSNSSGSSMRGATYRHDLRIVSGSAYVTPNNNYAWTGQSGLNPGTSSTRSRGFTFRTDAPNGAQTCFRTYVSPGAGDTGGSTDPSDLSGTRCIGVNGPVYDYVPDTPTFSGSTQVGTPITVNSRVRNVGAGTGRNYTHRLEITSGAAYLSPGTNQTWSNQAGLGSGSGRTRGVSFGISASTPAGTNICFRTYVAPGAGQSAPSTYISDSSDRSAIRCFTATAQLYDYIPVTPSLSSGSPESGGNITITSRVNNSAASTGNGANYNHQLRIDEGAAYLSPATNTSWNNRPGLAPGTGRNQTQAYSISAWAPAGEKICWRTYVAPGAGQSAPSTYVSDASDQSSQFCIYVTADFYDYVPQTPTYSPGIKYANSSYTTFSEIINDPSSTGAGPSYNQGLHVVYVAPNVTPDSTQVWLGQPGLAIGASRTQNEVFTINEDATHNDTVCHYTSITPGAGQSPPSRLVTVNRDTSPTSCVTIYNQRFDIQTPDTTVPSTITFSPATLLPGQTFTVQVPVCNTAWNPAKGPQASNAGPAPNVNTTVNGGTNATDVSAVNATDTINRGAGGCETYTYDGQVSTTAQLGQDVCVDVSIDKDTGFSDDTDTSGPLTYSSCVDVAESAFLTVPNGSVWAGGNFDRSVTGIGSEWCELPGGVANSGNGFIAASQFDDGSNPVVGAYATYHVGATGTITSFGSLSPITRNLMMANSNASTPGAVSGEFNTRGKCMSDLWTYLSQDDTIPLVQNVAGFPAADPLAPRVGQYITPASTDITINVNQQIQEGEKITLIVDGNVTIDADITYENYSVSRPYDIPILIIIARGDIDITGSVQELAGVYMARPTDTTAVAPFDGTIDTCSTAPASGNLRADVCNNQLTVRGIFAANDIQFRRTHGGISGANPANGGQVPAEIFAFNPDIYLASPIMISANEPSLQIDFLKDLPPVLN